MYATHTRHTQGYLGELVSKLRGDLHFLLLLLQYDGIEHLTVIRYQDRSVYYQILAPSNSLTSDLNPVAAKVQPIMV